MRSLHLAAKAISPKISFTVIIPARYASSRFPGKMLAELQGKPILLRVYDLALASGAKNVYIATDDERIATLASKARAPVVMTSPQLRSGTERVYAAAKKLGLGAADILVNVQGDEPLLPPENIHQVVGLLAQDTTADMATLAVSIKNKQELQDPNCVKVVCDKRDRALFFSRSPIPSGVYAETRADGWWRHIGIYAYRLAFLDKYMHWQETFYERAERLEQLRALYHCADVRIARAQRTSPGGVDTPQDLQTLEAFLANRD